METNENNNKKKGILLTICSSLLLILISVMSVISFVNKEKGMQKPKGVKPDKKCPFGYNEKDNKCVKITEVSPGTTCHRGGNLAENDICIAYVFSNPTYKCDEGKLDGNQNCINSVPAKISCDLGEPDGDVCYLDKGAPTCKEGVLENGECVKKTTKPSTDPEHPEDEVIITKTKPLCDESILKNGKCVMSSGKVKKTCPEGFTVSGNNCIKTFGKAKGICPPGANLENGRCIGTTSYKASKNPDPKVRCPKNFEDLGDKCRETKEKEHILICPKGTKLNDQDKLCYKY